jgi:hypothetical protein
LTVVDQIIGREVGLFFWEVLPSIYPGLRRDLASEELLNSLRPTSEPTELKKVRAENPLVEYPVIFLNSESTGMSSLFKKLLRRPPSPVFSFPPKYGAPLPLAEYLAELKAFLVLQLYENENIHVSFIMRAIAALSSQATQEELLIFVDQLWRGRWIIGDLEWSIVRRFVIAGVNEEAEHQIQDDIGRLTEESLRLIQTERKLKETCASIDDWLHETYCLIPDIATWYFWISLAKTRCDNGELEKYARVLDEFQADIHTTSYCANEPDSLCGLYAVTPLLESGSCEEAVRRIRGIFKGRSIITKAWFETAAAMIEKLGPNAIQSLDLDAERLDPDTWARKYIPEEARRNLAEVDLVACFGRQFTAKGRSRHWEPLLHFFGYSVK